MSAAARSSIWCVPGTPRRRIASGNLDNAVRIWDAGIGQQVGAPLTGHADGVLGVAFSPDGRRIVSGCDDNTLRLWPSPAAWTELLCSKLATNMRHKQWRDWISPDIPYITVCPALPVAPD